MTGVREDRTGCGCRVWLVLNEDRQVREGWADGRTGEDRLWTGCARFRRDGRLKRVVLASLREALDVSGRARLRCTDCRNAEKQHAARFSGSRFDLVSWSDGEQSARK